MRHRVNAASILQTLPPHLRAMVQVLLSYLCDCISGHRAFAIVAATTVTAGFVTLLRVPSSLPACQLVPRCQCNVQSKMTPRVGMLASVPSANHGSLARILNHTSYTPPALTPDATTPLRCSACGTSNGVPPHTAAPVSPAQVCRRPPFHWPVNPWVVTGAADPVYASTMAAATLLRTRCPLLLSRD